MEKEIITNNNKTMIDKIYFISTESGRYVNSASEDFVSISSLFELAKLFESESDAQNFKENASKFINENLIVRVANKENFTNKKWGLMCDTLVADTNNIKFIGVY